MRHTCEHCETRYEIPDEKIGHKPIKVRCSTCRGTMWVVPTRAGTVPTPDQFPGGSFYYSARGHMVGPLPAHVLAELARCGEIGARTYVYSPAALAWERVVESNGLRWLYDVVMATYEQFGDCESDVFARAALLSDGTGYFPDPTLKSGLILLDQTAQTRLAKLARKHHAAPRRSFSRLVATYAAAAVLGVCLGVGAHELQLGPRPRPVFTAPAIELSVPIDTLAVLDLQ